MIRHYFTLPYFPANAYEKSQDLTPSILPAVTYNGDNWRDRKEFKYQLSQALSQPHYIQIIVGSSSYESPKIISQSTSLQGI